MKKLKYIKLFENYDPDDLVKIKQLLLNNEISNVKLGLTMLSQAGQVKEVIADIEEDFIQNLKNFRKSDILEMRKESLLLIIMTNLLNILHHLMLSGLYIVIKDMLFVLKYC